MITKTGKMMKEAGLLDHGVRVGASLLSPQAEQYAMRAALHGGGINPAALLSSGVNTNSAHTIAKYVEILKNRISSFERAGGNLSQQRLTARNYNIPDSAIQMPQNFNIHNTMSNLTGNA